MAFAKNEKPAIAASAKEIRITDNTVKLSTLAKLPPLKKHPLIADLKKLGLEVTKDAAIVDVSVAGRQRIGDVLKSYGFTRLTILGRNYIKEEVSAPRVAVAKPTAPKLPAKPTVQPLKSVQGKSYEVASEAITVIELIDYIGIGRRTVNQQLKVFNISIHLPLVTLGNEEFENLMVIFCRLGVANLKIAGEQYIENNLLPPGPTIMRRVRVQRAFTAQQECDIRGFFESADTTGKFNAVARLYSQSPEVISSMVTEIIQRKLFSDFKGAFINKLYVGLAAKGTLILKGIIYQGIDGANGKFDIHYRYDTSVLFCDENEGAVRAAVQTTLGDTMWKCYGEGTPTSFRKRKAAKEDSAQCLTVAQLEAAIYQAEGFRIVFRTHADNETGATTYTKRPKKIRTIADLIGHLYTQVPLLKNASLRYPIGFVITRADGSQLSSNDVRNLVI